MEGTSVKLYAYDMQPYVSGDVTGDGLVTCADLAAAKAAIGTRLGNPRYSSRADMDSDGVIDIRDIAAIARLVPAGTVCQ
jgi:hypothetical protein